MMLTLFNSLTRKKEVFVPKTPGHISLYVCGITVYDRCHLGHARTMVCFDIMVRFLRHLGYTVNYVRNITDIDDKIIARANERGISIQALTTHFIQAMHDDAQSLDIQAPTMEPKATEFIPPMIALIQSLIEKGFAYVSANGDVCYRVEAFKEYGKLSHKDLTGLLAGARVEITQEKHSPLDFVLWKKAKPDEPAWDSPWGLGRPGWHIECSTMALQALGTTFDIHGGGIDLQFPHHENEIAQSEGATGEKFANYWLHVGMLQINNEKMAKSTGNFFTIEAVLQEYHPEVIRYFFMSSIYRSALNYSSENLANAQKALTRLYQSLKEVPPTSNMLEERWVEKFNQAMNDDFNTPEALAVFFNLSHEINKTKSAQLSYTLHYLANILGLLQENPEAFLQRGAAISPTQIHAFIQERIEARQARNWERADEIRQLLNEQGIELEDTAAGTNWRKKY